jgi:hypothetical protein
MAQVNAFNAALARLGFNADTANAIIDVGFDSLEVLLEVEEDDVDQVIKNVRETRRVLGAQAQGNVTFPFLAIRRLKAMHGWAAEMRRTGRQLNVGLFAGAMITTAVLRYSVGSMRSSTMEDEVIDKPKELTDLAKWETFWEQWKTYMGRVRGAAKCPLTYTFRDHEIVDPALHLLNYPDHDARLIATTTLDGPWFLLDNQRTCDEFKSLVLKGPGWNFIKTFDRLKNSRGAVLALRRQCEGTSAIQSRQAAAYAKIATAKYNGQKCTFTFDNYVEVHQGAHNTLLDLNEPVPETKKVTDFLAGITDPRLSNAKDLILGDAQRLQDFESCQQYLKTLIFNKTTQEKHERQISGIKQGKQSGSYKGRRLNAPGGETPGKGDEVSARTYTQEEWSKLTDGERAKVKQLRKDRKSNRLGGRGPSIRNTSAVSQTTDGGGSDDGSYQDETVNPASDSSSDSESEHNANATSPTRRSGRSVVGRRN